MSRKAKEIGKIKGNARVLPFVEGGEDGGVHGANPKTLNTMGQERLRSEIIHQKTRGEKMVLETRHTKPCGEQGEK